MIGAGGGGADAAMTDATGAAVGVVCPVVQLAASNSTTRRTAASGTRRTLAGSRHTLPQSSDFERPNSYGYEYRLYRLVERCYRTEASAGVSRIARSSTSCDAALATQVAPSRRASSNTSVFSVYTTTPTEGNASTSQGRISRPGAPGKSSPSTTTSGRRSWQSRTAEDPSFATPTHSRSSSASMR